MVISPMELAKKTMTPEKRRSAQKDFFAYYIGRPVSYVLTIPFLMIGLKPNTISFLSFFPSIIGFGLLGFSASKTVRIVGVIMFILWNFMDGIDGNVARYTGQTSTLGILWDAVSGYMAMMLMYFAVGISVMHTPKGLFNFFSIPDYCYIVLSGLTSIFTLFSRLVVHKKMLLFSKEAGDNLGNTETYFGLKTVVLNLTSPSGFVQIIMLLAVAMNCTREFVILYFMLYLAITCYTLITLLRET